MTKLRAALPKIVVLAAIVGVGYIAWPTPRPSITAPTPQTLKDPGDAPVSRPVENGTLRPVEAALKERRYEAAFQAVKAMQGSVGGRQFLERVDEEIRKDFKAVEEVGQRLEKERKYPETADHYRVHAPRFKGTQHYGYLSNKPDLLTEIAKAGTPAVTTQIKVEIQETMKPEPPKVVAQKPEPAKEMAKASPKEVPASVPLFGMVTVSARGDPTRVEIVFNAPVGDVSAKTIAHDAITPGIKVLAARRGMDPRIVTLTTSPMAGGIPYTLTVTGVADYASTPNPIAPGSRKEFAFLEGRFAVRPPKEPGQDGPKLPKFKQPVMFNTKEADAILSAMQVFPKNNAWNEDISKRPVHPLSDKMIDGIGRDKNIDFNWDMGFIIVPPDQPRVVVKIVEYPDESDKGPYPLPDNTPIEGWPVFGGKLEELQRTGEGDRHMIVVDPWNGMLYEFYVGRKQPSGWEASSEATFDLKSNKNRPLGWTSSDAAGLPIFPSLPRYDECERGAVDHALRFTIRRTRKEFIYPARHHAGQTDDPSVPAMGQRFRLKASVDISGFPKHARAIMLALKKYGMFVADNGGDWRVSVPPDRRLNGMDSFRRLKGSDFEVVVTTGEREGPRSGRNP